MKQQEALEVSKGHQEGARWEEAEDVIRAALRSAPADPELSGELCRLLCLAAREDAAMEYLPAAAAGSRGSGVLQLLSDYFHCRKLAKRIGAKDSPDSLKMVKELALAQGIELPKPPGISLSACLIVKNEEKRLPDCLQSLAEFANEVVVVDTGSTDRTVKVARKAGAVLGEFKWCDDFSAARNYALSLATGDWILWIDADERLNVENAGSLLSALIRPHFGGYTIPIENFTNEDEGQDCLVHHACRLFRRLDSIRFEGRIHEQVTVGASGLPIAALEGVSLKHYGYLESEMREKGKHERTISMLRREVEDDPADAFHLFNLGNALYTAGQYDESAEWLGRAAARLEPGTSYGQFCYHLLGFALFYAGWPEEALEACADADEAGCGGQLIEYTRAFVLRGVGRYEQALAASREAQRLEIGPRETGDRSIREYKAKYLEAQILANLGATEHAEKCYREVLRKAPGFTPAQLGLALELRRQNETEEALIVAKGVIGPDENGRIAADLALICADELGQRQELVKIRESVWRMDSSPDACLQWARAAERAEDWPAAVTAYAEYVETFEPTADVLINSGRALQALGRYQLALGCYEKAITAEPHNANAFFNAGDLLYKCGKYAEAIEAYRSGILLDETNADAWFSLGNALIKLGAPDASIVALEQAMRLDPGHDRAEHNLAIAREALHQRAS